MATTGGSLQPIYKRLNETPTYHPLKADTFADWSMEAGDLITVTRDGDNYKSPVNTTTLTWKKGQKMTVSSDGSEKRKPIAKVSQKKFSGGGGGGLRNSHYQHLYVTDAYNRLQTGLILAGSSAALYATQLYGQLSAGLELTASNAALYVENKYKEMKAGLEASYSSSRLYVESKTKKAELLLTITDGKSKAKLTADTIDIDGLVENLESVNLKVGDVDSEGSISADQNISAGGTVSGLVGSFEDSLYVGEDDVGDIMDAFNDVSKSTSGNNITLTFTGPHRESKSVTFSRAITSWTVSGGSGRVRVTASPQDQHEDVYLKVQGAEDISSNGEYTFRAYYEKDDGTYSDTGAKLTTTISVTPAKSDISATRSNMQATMPSTDSLISAIRSNGWYVITITVNGVQKTYRLQVDV